MPARAPAGRPVPARLTARLPHPWGRLIDRDRPVAFTFDGRTHEGFAGDVIASALMAGGRHVLSRSFKYHRPRGALTMAGHDVNSLVQIADDPNVRGDRHPIEPGMAVRSVNRLGTLDRDWLAGIERVSRFLPVGFYYKTFFRPDWRWFERPIRAMAGLGRLDPEARHVASYKAYLFCDVLVVGGGPAGLAAALASAEAGADTLLVDEWPELGGSLLYGRGREPERAALVARAEASPSLTIMRDTAVTGLFADNWASAVRGARFYKIRAGQVVLATGAFDQPFVFRNNDRPGVLFADAAQRLMRLYGVRPGTRAVVATANRFGYEAALDLLDGGVAIAAILDLQQAASEPCAAQTEARARGLTIMDGAVPLEVVGRHHVEAVVVGATAGGPRQVIPCDLLAMGAGYTPALNLACHVGARAVYDPAIAMHRAQDVPPGVRLAGSAANVWADDAVTEDGRRVGAAAAAEALDGASSDEAAAPDPEAARITHPWPMFGGGKDFLDFDEDLTTADIVHTVADGYNDIQLVKRYSTAGLGPSQGRHANLNTIRLVARETGRDIERVGTTTFRPPLIPETFGHLAGQGFEPVRRTPMHHRHLELGARMMVAGAWRRPAYYGRKDEAEAAIRAEVQAVRTRVGLIDVSTLGGLEVRGPDAAAFLERMYTGPFAKQPVGRARYALMTDQTGVVIDDGVACRLHERHFYVTATTGAVDQVYRHMGWWNAQWRMDVDVAAVTGAYAGVNIAGPLAREVLATLATDLDLSAEAFPYMGVRTGHLDGIPVRILRVGFVGELGFEIHGPAGFGEALWDRVMEAGRPFGIRPFGVEAQRVLRLEKGHVIVGQDTDGLTNPVEAGMGWAIGKTKTFYVGKRAVDIQVARDRDRGVARRLVGFTLTDPAAPAPKECHLVIRNGAIAGRVTSAARSPTLNRVVGLAYVQGDQETVGTRFSIRIDGGRMVEAEVVPIPFYDPDNARQEL